MWLAVARDQALLVEVTDCLPAVALCSARVGPRLSRPRADLARLNRAWPERPRWPRGAKGVLPRGAGGVVPHLFPVSKLATRAFSRLTQTARQFSTKMSDYSVRKSDRLKAYTRWTRWGLSFHVRLGLTPLEPVLQARSARPTPLVSAITRLEMVYRRWRRLLMLYPYSPCSVSLRSARPACSSHPGA